MKSLIAYFLYGIARSFYIVGFKLNISLLKLALFIDPGKTNIQNALSNLKNLESSVTKTVGFKLEKAKYPFFYKIVKIFYKFAIVFFINGIDALARFHPNKSLVEHINYELTKFRQSLIEKKVVKIKFDNILPYCKKTQDSSVFIYQEKGERIFCEEPKIINSNNGKNYPIGKIALPRTYLVKLNNTKVFARTDLIIHNDEVALYDEVSTEKKYIYGIKSPVVSKINGKFLYVDTCVSTISLKEGVHLLKDHCVNYFHWLLENIPRLMMLKNMDQKIPLLVSDDLPRQFYEALDAINFNNFPIIKLKIDHTYKVGTLYYPSALSIIHDNYGIPDYKLDILMSEKAARYLRTTIARVYKIDYTEKPYRKIFIIRKRSGYRCLINTDEIANYLSNKGFEVVSLEDLSFESQVRIFSQAKIIIGQSGAGLSNATFAHPEAKILIFFNDTPNSNVLSFNFISSALGISVDYILGNSFQKLRMRNIHDSFVIDLKLVKDWLDSI
jgi:hypothetical protein